MDDSEGAQARIVLKFAEQLKEHLDIPVHLQDERLSSFGAEEKMAFADFTGSSGRRPNWRRESKKRKKHLDAIAAAEILEAFLEQKSR
jgi:putative Holliday junction resolvase